MSKKTDKNTPHIKRENTDIGTPESAPSAATPVLLVIVAAILTLYVAYGN